MSRIRAVPGDVAVTGGSGGESESSWYTDKEAWLPNLRMRHKTITHVIKAQVSVFMWLQGLPCDIDPGPLVVADVQTSELQPSAARANVP